MKIILLMFLVACDFEPEAAVEKAGGRVPVLCLRTDNESNMTFCRDAEKKMWVCSAHKGSGNCVALDRVKTTLDGVLPEKPPPP